MATAAKLDGRVLRPIADSYNRLQIINAIETYDISSDPVWSEFDALSTQTEFDSLEAVPEGIFESGEATFEAAATVYVTLNYGNGADAISASETFPAHVKGHFEAKSAVIDVVNVDTSSFRD